MADFDERDDARGRSPSPRPEARSPIQERGRPSEKPSNGAGEYNPGNNLHVSGLSARVTDRDLEDLFSKHGKITKAQVMYDPHSREPRGFGFVTFETAEEADAALADLDGHELLGRVLKIAKAKRGRARTPTPGQYYGPPKREGGGGGGGGGRGGYRGPPGGGYDYRGPPATSMRGGDPYGRDFPVNPSRDYPPRGGYGGGRYGDSGPPPRDYGGGYDRYDRGGPAPARDYPARAPRDRSPGGRGGPPGGGSGGGRYNDALPPPRSRYDDLPPRRY